MKAAEQGEQRLFYPVLGTDPGESIMMNPMNTQPRQPSDQDSPTMKASEEGQVRESGFMGWIHRHFGSEHPHRQGANFFVSDVTDGGVGTHHHHRQDKRH